MSTRLRVVLPAVFLIGIAGAAIVRARSESASRAVEKKEALDKKEPVDRKKKVDRKTISGVFKGDPALNEWVKTLLQKVADPHDSIRESARIALIQIGRPAMPALQTLIDSGDAAKAVAARRIIAAIENQSYCPGEPTPAFGHGPGMGHPGGPAGELEPWHRGHEGRHGPGHGPGRGFGHTLPPAVGERGMGEGVRGEIPSPLIGPVPAFHPPKHPDATPPTMLPTSP